MTNVNITTAQWQELSRILSEEGIDFVQEIGDLADLRSDRLFGAVVLVVEWASGDLTALRGDGTDVSADYIVNRLEGPPEARRRARIRQTPPATPEERRARLETVRSAYGEHVMVTGADDVQARRYVAVSALLVPDGGQMVAYVEMYLCDTIQACMHELWEQTQAGCWPDGIVDLDTGKKIKVAVTAYAIERIPDDLQPHPVIRVSGH